MAKQLFITKLKKDSILQSSFETLSTNNTIAFSDQGIAVVYAPNGTGKTTISKIFQGEKHTEIEAEFEGKSYRSMVGEPLFHVINDQISRNIIAGTTDEFILGEDIAKERQAKVTLDQAYQSLIDSIKGVLKNDFKVAKQSTPFIDAISEEEIKTIISTIGKRGAKTEEVDIEKFVSAFSTRIAKEEPAYEDACLQFFLTDMSDKASSSIIQKLRGVVVNKIGQAEGIRTIERNDTAISILQKYEHLTYCIVCDTKGIDPANLIETKTNKNKEVYSALSKETKDLLGKIATLIPKEDPLGIKEAIIASIETGNAEKITALLAQFSFYQTVAETLMNNRLLQILAESTLVALYNEYKIMLENKLELQEDDEILIKDIIADSLGREVLLERDAEKNIIIKLGDTQLLGTERQAFHLSTGEQNFISLAFELLKAKNVLAPIIVMDDPISSFDSIYKNKIAYCIVKILEKKQQIIFTHNIDLIRLLDVQRTHCFSLYLLGNDSSEPCGFIPVKSTERSILLYLDKLLDYLRSSEADAEIIDERTYIISLVPFMRAIIKIVNPEKRKEYTDSLTALMHGYGTDVIDITPIYNLLFSKTIGTSYQISAQDIIALDVGHLNFMNNRTYPLLVKTLKHTLLYLYLRLNVEKTLREKFPKETKKCELLGEFIYRALKDKKYQSERVKLTAKKTLLNEFNHYEGNFNIFQPAIDITDANLEKEKVEILQILNDIKTKP